jgi:hypothetical protein
MNVGMLWYDGERGIGVPERIQRAVDHYRAKYGAEPTLCLVNPALGDGHVPRRIGGLEIRTSRSVLQYHFWIGVGQPSAGTGPA